MWRVVCRPEWLRAPLRFFFSVSAMTGPPLCRCERSTLTTKRVPGEVGFILMSAIALPLLRRRAGEIDRLAGLEPHVGLLEAIAATGDVLETARLARAVQQVHALHLDLEHQLHGLLDLALGG